MFTNNIFFLFNHRIQQVEGFLEETLLDILQDPTRIFNGDKSSFHLSPKTGNVLACQGDKIFISSQRPCKSAYNSHVHLLYFCNDVRYPCWYIHTKEYYLKSRRVPDDWSMTIYKMFEETVRSKLTAQLTWIKEGKMRQNLHSRDGLMH